MQDDERIGEGSDGHGAGVARGPTGRVGPRQAAIGLVVAAYAWWAVGLAAFSLVATLAVLLAGLAAVAVGAHGRVGAPPLASRRWRHWWAALVAAAAAAQVTAYVQHPRSDHPTISSLTNALLDSHTSRAVAFVAWLAAAMGLARR